MATTFVHCTKRQCVNNTVLTPYEVTSKGAWCWFADPRAIHHQSVDGSINKSYIGYIDVHGNIKAMQHDFVTGESNEVLVRSYFQPDDHDNPTFLILPDDRVMIFYSRHTDEPCFYYRISTKPGDVSSLGKEHKIATKNNTTYPSPFILSDDPKHFYICWRGISWHPTMAKFTIPTSDDKTECVWGPFQMVQSTASRPYAKYASNGKDKIVMAYTTGHPDPTMPNYLYYNYVDINTLELKDVRGRVLSKLGEDLYHVAATAAYQESFSDAVVDASSLRNWLWQVTLDKDEKPLIAMVTINENKSSHDYYYARWNGEAWQKSFLANGGGHFHQSPNIEKCYSGGMAIDDQNTNEVYCSVPVDGKFGRVYEIIKYVLDVDGQICSSDTLTKNSEFNNIRPYVIAQRGDSPLKLTWMYGDYYDWIVSAKRPKGFCTGIRADYNVKRKLNISEGDDVLHYEDAQDKQVKRVFSLDPVDNFTVQLEASLDTANYWGDLITTECFSYGIDQHTLKAYVRVKDQAVYLSTNTFGNSDIWKYKPRATNGVWWNVSPYSSVSLTVSYSNKELITYINGAIDQVINMNVAELNGIQITDIVERVHSLNVFSK
ncbi:BNR repeat-containing protein [Saccharicrinis fermentans]|uniref:BNR repeat-containing protein n=1 Tax=Saccharicrinis fermentans TaxID=982 RepID=UPI00138AD28F|nr:BNR repeat-containing protein [Saccharicrinis fermentans]